jgi:hypothetical protein
VQHDSAVPLQQNGLPPPAVVLSCIARGANLRPHGSPPGKNEADGNGARQSLTCESDRIVALVLAELAGNVSGDIVLYVLCQPGICLRL